MHVHGIKARKEKKTLIQHVKGKQVVTQRNRYSKTYKNVKTEAYYVKEKKKQKQKTNIKVSKHEYACAYISLRTHAGSMHMHHTLKNPNPGKQEHKQSKTLKRQIQQPNMILNTENTKPQAKQTYLNTTKQRNKIENKIKVEVKGKKGWNVYLKTKNSLA